jgi:mannose-6-phosphate isomerase-like protein (cupin superfamily)
VQPSIVRPDAATEFVTPERCFILETWNDLSDAAVSIVRARVEPGVTTQLHSLDVDERYVIVEGEGVAHIGDVPGTRVGPGDIVVIPAGTPQQIANTCDSDLLFYCVCTPRFEPKSYRSLE